MGFIVNRLIFLVLLNFQGLQGHCIFSTEIVNSAQKSPNPSEFTTGLSTMQIRFFVA